MHIGLIGGIGPAATDFYHRGLIERHHAAGRPLDLTIAYADVREMSRNMANKDPARQAQTFARLVGRLKAAGRRDRRGHFDGRALLRARARSDLALADPQRHS